MCTDGDICTPNSGGYHQENISHSSFSVTQHLSGDQQNNINLSETSISVKKKRAATKHVASISLKDLAKYFNLPIIEASKNLKVGLSVLKRKCREYGIPRWPHRKIKSLETLIHNVQEEVSRQELEKKDVAAKAAARRQRMLESEKKCIERRPFMELQGETKRFRQDVFKRRHKAKVQSKELRSQATETIESGYVCIDALLQKWQS
ncbi:hypothetical protein J5N97_024867 [Dioscorea zingiberensis]|uniref:RWP-RK domain-containing protein n=1 Tax=Dioscorea zingiberensis TaxID=325984 RepID=A0A9D5H9C4_9LILI|nr:hypothetical protein J5N97_024867 [Dioscorea zingiberensis]